MEEALEMLRTKDTKARTAGVDRLHLLLESSKRTLSTSELISVVDCCVDLIKENSNFRVTQGAMLALSAAAVVSPAEQFRNYFNCIVPAVVERLGDGKQSVRDGVRQLLVKLMEISSPMIIVERAGAYAWSHRSWRVREEFAHTVAAAIRLFACNELALQRTMLASVLQLLSDSNFSVREAATLCIEEMYLQAGHQFSWELGGHHLPPLISTCYYR